MSFTPEFVDQLEEYLLETTEVGGDMCFIPAFVMTEIIDDLKDGIRASEEKDWA